MDFIIKILVLWRVRDFFLSDIGVVYFGDGFRGFGYIGY